MKKKLPAANGLLKNPPRRSFLVGAAATTLGIACATPAGKTPSLFRLGYRSPNERLLMGGIGAGGKGSADIQGVQSEDIAALCDIDWKRGAAMFDKFPKATRYKDFRVMLEKEKLDAVTISTADHTHAVAAIAAMQRGIHVYLQKPLTHNIAELKLLLEASRKYGVATQMGNQGHSNEGSRQACEMIWSGAIGTPKEVHAWTDRPIWPQGVANLLPAQAVPDHVDWDLFLGPAPAIAYNPGYHPFKWRGFRAFGCGALGDMACHVLDVPNWALDLRDPISIECVQQEGRSAVAFPTKSVVKFDFAARGARGPVQVYWYDGGAKPPAVAGVDDPTTLFDKIGGCYITGDKGVIGMTAYGDKPRLLPDTTMADYKLPDPVLTRSPGHYRDFIRACKGGDKACSNFEYAVPFTEWVLLGSIAQSFEGKLLWDAEKGRFSNNDAANQALRREYRPGWEIRL